MANESPTPIRSLAIGFPTAAPTANSATARSQRINDKNARKLGLAWFADLDTNRAQEATPLIVDGVMYISTAWSLVKAYDARSGKLLWAYDPQVHRELGDERLLRCGQSRRGRVES